MSDDAYLLAYLAMLGLAVVVGRFIAELLWRHWTKQ